MNTTRTYIAQFLVLSVALTLALGANYLYAAWTPAPANPPGNNVDAPINVGSAEQTKTGDLTVAGISPAKAGITTDVLSVLGATSISGKLGIGNTPVYQLDLTDAYSAFPSNREGIRFPDGSVQTSAASAPADSLSVLDAGYIRYGFTEPNSKIHVFSPGWKIIFFEGDSGNQSDDGALGGYVYIKDGVTRAVFHNKSTYSNIQITTTEKCVGGDICFSLDGAGNLVLELKGNNSSTTWLAI